VDLFYGQLKSRVQCTVCHNISITFDPYNVLSVPIPTQSLLKQVQVTYYPKLLSQQVMQFSFQIDPSVAKVQDLAI
jgi:ubiquitin carboxyl-terminal hydrolase 4/11